MAEPFFLYRDISCSVATKLISNAIWSNCPSITTFPSSSTNFEAIFKFVKYCITNMLTQFIKKIDFVSSMQCQICIYNKAVKLEQKYQKPQHILIDDEAFKNLQVQRQNEKIVVKGQKILCRGCKLQRYCSSKHLVEDKEHHEICRVLSELQKIQNIQHPLLLNGPINCRNQLQQTIAQLMLAVRVKLQRPLSPRESELICYPSYCVICYRLDGLTTCKACNSVAYCSDEHRCVDKQKHTLLVCETLTLYYSPYRYLNSKFNVISFKQFTELAHSHLVEAFYNATGIKVDSKPWRYLKDYEHYLACSTFSGIGSICLALSNISFTAETNEVLSVYILGANESHHRYFQPMHLMFFFEHYQDVCQLDLYLIGQHLQRNSCDEIQTFNLRGKKRKTVKRTFSMTFASFVKIQKINPVLIIIFNPDFASINNITEDLVDLRYPHAMYTTNRNDFDWHPCLLETLFTYGVPICLTSPTKMQYRSDITCVKVLARNHRIAVKHIYNGKENPYREILPLHNPCPDDDESIAYANNYLEVIITSVSY